MYSSIKQNYKHTYKTKVSYNVVFCLHNDKAATKLAYVLDDWSPTDSKCRVIKKYSRDCGLTPRCFSIWQMGLAGVSLPDVCPQTLNISEMRENSLSLSRHLCLSLFLVQFSQLLLWLYGRHAKISHLWSWFREKACPSCHISDAQIHAPKHK